MNVADIRRAISAHESRALALSMSQQSEKAQQAYYHIQVAQWLRDQSTVYGFKAARQRAGLTLEQVAKHIGVTKPSIWAWEHGRSKPTPQNLAALEKLFGY